MDNTNDPVTIVEVAPRDGLQNEAVALTTGQKLELTARAVGCGARHVEVTSFVHPAKVPAMADAEEVAAGLPRDDGVSYSALVLNTRGLQRAVDAGIGAVNFVVHCTEMFSQRNQGVDISGGIDLWHEVAARARAAGVRANLTLAAAFGCPFEGEVPVEQVVEIARKVLTSPPETLSLADTIGVAVPADVRARFFALAPLLPEEVELRAHFHNTRNTGTANALAAVEAGVTVLDSSLGGIGGCPFAPGATGNVATEDLVYALDRSGARTGLALTELLEASGWLEDVLGRPLPAMLRRAGDFPAMA